MARSRSRSRSSSPSSSSESDSDRPRAHRPSRSPGLAPRARSASRSASRERARSPQRRGGEHAAQGRPKKPAGGGQRADTHANANDPDDGREHARRDGAHRQPAEQRLIRGRGGNAGPSAPAAEPRERKTDGAPGGSKAGGTYVPPFKLAQMMAQTEDKSSAAYQRLTWDALRKSINGLVNKVNVSNLMHILPELFRENLVRGRGLLARSVLKSQMASPQFSGVLAALVAVVNTKLPEVGALVLRRAVLQFRRAFRRNDKPVCVAATRFLAALVVQRVAHELLALELLTLLLGAPTDDSVEIAVAFLHDCGYTLSELAPGGMHGVFERLRAVLHEGAIDKRVQFIIEGAFAHRKAGFEGAAGVAPGLDVVEEADQVVHELGLDDDASADAHLDVFAVDPDYAANEARYAALRREILGEASSSESDSDTTDEDEESEEELSDDDAPHGEAAAAAQVIKDASEANLVNLRRTIYLTIMSSLDFEEAGHKLLKINLAPGQEGELCTMLVECCSQERTYLRYYGLLAGRFCFLNSAYQAQFDEMFAKQYATVHRLETNKLRNVARFFAHLLASDALPWSVLAYVQLTEEATTSSSRIFVKILFQELAEQLGLKTLNARLNDTSFAVYFAGVLPVDSAKNTRFAINFFTSIGLGGLTDGLRAALKEMPQRIAAQQAAIAAAAGSSSSSSSTSSGSDSSSSSSSSSSSEEPKRKKKRHG